MGNPQGKACNSLVPNLTAGRVLRACANKALPFGLRSHRHALFCYPWKNGHQG